MSEQIVNALVHVFYLVVPEAILVGAACLFFLGGTFRNERRLWSSLALAALAGAGIAFVATWPSGVRPDEEIYATPIFLDWTALLIKAVALVGGAVLVLLSWNEVPDEWAAEHHACLLLIVAGLCLTGAANELVTLFLALELISIPTYVLLYLPRHDDAAREAATKYFLLSVFSSAFPLFGFSYLYGLGGTTNLPALAEALRRGDGDLARQIPHTTPALALIALVMVVTGLGFKITAVPFHFYAPDVFQGSTTGSAALLAFLPKAAGFTALLRVLGSVLAGKAESIPALGPQTPLLLCILAAATMTLGNILALLQSNLRRLLAYSSVAHAGYMLIGLAAAQNPDFSATAPTPLGVQAVLFYLVAYGAMTVGAFAVLAHLSTPQRTIENEDDLLGLAGSHPWTALLMAVFLFSLIGMPLTAGFAGKMMLFFGALAVEGERAVMFRWIAALGAVNAAIGGWYYLRILTKMYLHKPIKPLETPRPWPGFAALWICAAVTLFLGIFPETLVRLLGKG